MYYGNKYQCNYNTGDKNDGDLIMPFIKVENPNAIMRFNYFRDVEYNPLRNSDVFSVVLEVPYGPYIKKTLMLLDSTMPSEKQWVQSPDLSLGEAFGYEARIHFIFDTKDSVENDHRGIAIDNVELIGARWSSWAETSGEVILDWIGGLPKYFVYRGTNPDFSINPPELIAYTPFNHKYENSLLDDNSYYYIIKLDKK